MLTRDQILQASTTAAASKDVEVPRWGGTVRVKLVTVADLGRFHALVQKYGTELRDACLMAVSVVDENGVRLFSDNDVPSLGAMNGATVQKVVEAAASLNMMTEASQEAAKNG